jgi:2-phospho-L-lactate guanylyltransferase
MELSALMFTTTLRTLLASKLDKVVVVSSDQRIEHLSKELGAVSLHQQSDTGVNAAVRVADEYCLKENAGATMVIPVDLPLLKPEDVNQVMELGNRFQKAGVVICPSQRYDGTNALLRKPPVVMNTHYDNNSYHQHLKSAGDLGIQVVNHFSPAYSWDLDTAEDALEFVSDERYMSNPVVSFLESRIRLVRE